MAIVFTKLISTVGSGEVRIAFTGDPDTSYYANNYYNMTQGILNTLCEQTAIGSGYYITPAFISVDPVGGCSEMSISIFETTDPEGVILASVETVNNSEGAPWALFSLNKTDLANQTMIARARWSFYTNLVDQKFGFAPDYRLIVDDENLGYPTRVAGTVTPASVVDTDCDSYENNLTTITVQFDPTAPNGGGNPPIPIGDPIYTMMRADFDDGLGGVFSTFFLHNYINSNAQPEPEVVSNNFFSGGQGLGISLPGAITPPRGSLAQSFIDNIEYK